MYNCSVLSKNADRKITLPSSKHSFTLYPSLSHYRQMDGHTTVPSTIDPRNKYRFMPLYYSYSLPLRDLDLVLGSIVLGTVVDILQVLVQFIQGINLD